MGRIRNILRRLSGSESEKVDGLSSFEERIGYIFQDRELLVRALKHRSFVYSEASPDAGNGADANERLEFLGDAVLGLVVTEHLYRKYPDQREGDLTKRKSVLVSKTVLAVRAKAIGLNKQVLLSEVEDSAGGRTRRSILGDCFEALLGAIYLDGGLEPVTNLLERELLDDLENLTVGVSNHKSALLEYVQARGIEHPVYSISGESGPDHSKTFVVEVSVDGQILGEGSAGNKKEAQQRAAKAALEALTKS